MRSILPLFTLLAITSALAAPGRGGSKSWGQCSNDLTAKTKAGTFTGFIGSETPDVAQWLGVPYGAPPIGDQRFLPPKPAAYAGDMLTTSYKPICMQNGGPGSGVFWEVVPQFQNMDPQAEDCLYLNIWGPTKAIGGGGKSNGNQKQEKLPVIIWICGGGFQEGGGHAAYQVPDHWVQRTQTHLVVTFNYRLSVWGYPGARAAPVNAGLADIRMVVEWLRDNVEAFGGDPDHMVLWGQSAGGNAANSYGYANGEDPIVAGIVAQSGTTSQINSPNTTAFTTLAAQFGCDGLDAEAELQCMQKADNDMLHDVIRNGDNVPRFSPVADGVTLFENNTARLEQGKVAKVPLIVGNTINEGAAFASPDSAPPMNVTFPFLQSVGCGVKTEAGLRMQYGLETYRYLSAGNFSNITPKYWLGAMHSSDIPLVFGTHYEFRGNSSELEWETSYSMEGFWYSLAAQTSDSPMDGLGHTWPEFGKSQEMVMFGNKTGPTLIVPGDYYDDVYMCDSVMDE